MGMRFWSLMFSFTWMGVLAVEFPCDLSSLAGCRDARLQPHDLIRKSWETAKLREETVSGLRVFFALFPPWHLYGPPLSEADIFFQLICVCLHCRCWGRSGCIPLSPWHMQASPGYPWVHISLAGGPSSSLSFHLWAQSI